MKKLLSSLVLTLTAMGSLSAPSFGSAFGLFTRGGCCGGRCGCDFCVRQYNAFSPVACGRICCDCMPSSNNCGSCGSGGPCAGGMCPGGLDYSGTMVGSADGANSVYPPQLPTTNPALANKLAPLPAPPLSNPLGLPQGTNQFVAPAPLPAGPSSQLVPYPTIQNAGYYPSFYPAYNYNYPNYNYGYLPPVSAQPQPMVAPSYWSK